MEGVEPLDNQIPREEGIDHSLQLLKEGYHFITNRQKNLQSDVFETRLLGKKTICMVGANAARIFYDSSKFERQDVVPNAVVKTLFGKNAVQTLDGEEHRVRKGLFMSVMNREKLGKIKDITAIEWEKAIDQWSKMSQVELYEEVKQLFCRVAFQWIGYPLKDEEVQKMSNELAALFETPAKIGFSNWIGRTFRNKLEKNLQQVVQKTRDKTIQFPKESIVHQFATFQDIDGELMDVETAAVELINIVRPIVAVAVYVNYTVLAMNQFPKQRSKLQTYGDYSQMFVQEVRRFYPFFPFVAARVKQDFTWEGYQFKQGTLTLLDLYGTNHDPNIWDNPSEFSPERFANWQGSPFSFIPQGGGDYTSGHRCAGEHVTIELMKVSVDYLINKMEFDITEKELNTDFIQIPSIPNITITNVKRSRSHA